MTSAPLSRRLGLGDAVFIGLGSMIGAGVFSAFVPAAAAAGAGLLIGLVIAAIVAWCNATSSAQLAAQYPESGGTYVYGRRQLGDWWGFAAGWSFVIGKTASCAAMAITFAAYAAPVGWQKPVAVAAVIALACVNYFGVTRTAQLTRILVVVALLALAIGVAAALSGPEADGSPQSQEGFFALVQGEGSVSGSPVSTALTAVVPGMLGGGLFAAGPYGILQSAGLLFFAFAGYARIATMGEEVRDPSKTIPRAVALALAIVVVVYAVVGLALLWALGPLGLATSLEPLVDAARGWEWTAPVITVGAAAASLGALLALFTGIGRTSLAMAREGDLPRVLSAVHPRYQVPHRAEIALAVVVCAVVLLADLGEAIAFSSFGVLLYYFVANLAAFTQKADARRVPRAVQIVGMVGCLVLVVTLPPIGIVAGVVVIAVGVVGRLLLRGV
ncbi:APC family permease [Okibacterium endophyticum]